MRAWIMMSVLLLSGCTICREQPMSCVAAAVIVGATAVYAERHRYHDGHSETGGKFGPNVPPCHPQPNGTCL